MNNNQRINQLLMQTRGLSSTNLDGTALIERLRKEAFALAAWSCREIDRITDERDEARRVLKAIVEEFVQHAQAMNPLYPATPMHECEFSWNPESGKCNACEAWGDYVLICHPLEETEEEDNDD